MVKILVLAAAVMAIIGSSAMACNGHKGSKGSAATASAPAKVIVIVAKAQRPTAPLTGNQVGIVVYGGQGQLVSLPDDLRLALNQLLSEHATLAAAATGSALGGRNEEFEAAAGALDMNSQDIAKAIGTVYGDAAGEAFLPLWRKHIGFFVEYTMATAKGSGKGQKKAVDDLLGYAGDFAAFLNSATPSLPKDAVADLVKMHILSLKDVDDAQANRDQKLAYQKIRKASHHMQMIADPLADAIAKPGTYGYFCKRHPSMKAKVVATEQGSALRLASLAPQGEE